MTEQLTDLTRLAPALPEHLLQSYALALQQAVQQEAIEGMVTGEVTVQGCTCPAIAVFDDEAFRAWHQETLAMFAALPLPDVANADALQAVPFFTRGLLRYLKRDRSAKPATAPGKKGGSGKKKDDALSPAGKGAAPAALTPEHVSPEKTSTGPERAAS